MIEALSLVNVATYGPVRGEMTGLSTFNYVYGPNGVGKTTLSRFIFSSGEQEFKACHLGWKAGVSLQAMVYNREFLEKNLDPSTDMKGIFTIGETNIKAIQEIEAAKKIRDNWSDKIPGLKDNLEGMDGNGGKLGELIGLRAAFKDKCWDQKKKHDAEFQSAFAHYGVRGDTEKFLLRVLQEHKSNTASLETLAILTEKAQTVFGPTPVKEDPLVGVSVEALVSYEGNSVLVKKVVGRGDVDIAAMINKLGNSDWVKTGRLYFETSDGFCPFCQQLAPHTLEQSLMEYFDETFIKDTQAISSLQTSYKASVEVAVATLKELVAGASRFLDIKALEAKLEVVKALVTVNLQRLEEKVKEPSVSIALDSMKGPLTEIDELIAVANEKIIKHNNMVAALGKERQNLIDQVWRYILDVELKDALSDYVAKSEAVKKAADGIAAAIKKASDAVAEQDAIIREIEKGTTSTKPTVDAINALLKSFNFTSFTIVPAHGTGYRLVRSNGADARKSLSEGERTFITFLYFYQLLRGSDSESGVTRNRVVVFDDPVSSLDSDILFIVSSLIRDVISDVRSGNSLIKQVFVLTHNVYFHKEVTYASNRSAVASMNEETFWTVRKRGGVSEIVRHEGNPIRTSYELLWQDVRKPENVGLSIQNTLRRIIESYFKILGGIDKDDLLSKFTGGNKVVAASLMSWVNDGSHGVHDDIFMAADVGTVEVYLTTFHQIFYRSNHESHYQMMMKEDYVPFALEGEAAVAPAAEPELA